jgi:hypothetical protein
MGIGRDLAEILIREHLYRPLDGDIVLIGRQTVYLSPTAAKEIAAEHGLKVPAGPVELDRSTINRRAAFADQDLISDRGLLSLLGATKVKALDHTDYEGAEIIHDLTKPLPEKLHGCADVVIDGSTLDNCFNPALTLHSYTQMLRPGGRLFSVNGWSNHHNPYVMPSPLWYLDYFVWNGFTDCKVYLFAFAAPIVATFTIDLERLARTEQITTFAAPGEVACCVVAEKSLQPMEISDPVQSHYRSPEQWALYKERLAKIVASKRPHVARSRGGPMPDYDIPGGPLYIDSSYRAMQVGDARKLR